MMDPEAFSYQLSALSSQFSVDSSQSGTRFGFDSVGSECSERLGTHPDSGFG